MRSGIYNPYDRLSGPNFDDAMPENAAPRMDMGTLEGYCRMHPDPSTVAGWRFARGDWSDWFILDQGAWNYYAANVAYMGVVKSNNSAIANAFGTAFIQSGGNFSACITAVGGPNPKDWTASANPYLQGEQFYPQLVAPYPASNANTRTEFRSGQYSGTGNINADYIRMTFAFIGQLPNGTQLPGPGPTQTNGGGLCLAAVPIVSEIGFLR